MESNCRGDSVSRPITGAKVGDLAGRPYNVQAVWDLTASGQRYMLVLRVILKA